MTPAGTRDRLVGEESYQWLPGGFFLYSRWDRRIGSGEHKGVGLIGYDPADRGYSLSAFDNLGFARTYRVIVRDGVWTYTGRWERASFIVGEGGKDMQVKWERSRDGSSWEFLCELKMTRVE
jgi:hypothetical protein